MTKILIEIKSCKECQHFKQSNEYSTDGWDRMADWICTKADKKIQGAVEWHEETKIEVPEWCPVVINDMYSEDEILEAMEPFKMNLPFHYEILIKELLQNQRNKPTL